MDLQRMRIFCRYIITSKYYIAGILLQMIIALILLIITLGQIL